VTNELRVDRYARVTQTSSGDRVPPGRGTVEVYVRQLGQLFDSMDPSPFHEKGLDADAEEYIVARAKQLPTGEPAALVIHVDQGTELPGEARLVGDAIRKHFAREAELLRWRLRRLIRRGSISLVIGLTVLAAGLATGEYLGQVLGGSHFARVFGESLHIGGWVAMWTPMEIFLYEWWPLLGERRLYERLGRMRIELAYAAAPETSGQLREGARGLAPP
jgi:hypothetical protein